ncbi:MAG: DciA family protein [Vibrio anguillarum]
MRDHRPTLTKELISDSSLKKIQQHATEILALNKVLNKLLPKGTADHVRAANVRGGHLIVEVASASIKMKLDYDRLHILNQLRNQGFAKLISIELKINPALYRNRGMKEEKETVARPPLSENTAQALLMVESSASPKVKKRLENLAKLARPK